LTDNFSIILISGGARSGKSNFALKEASKKKGKKAFIATAIALDKEMEERIQMHKKERGVEWDTYEEPLNISKVIEKNLKIYEVIVLDCLTLWISNLMMKYKEDKKEITEEIDYFIDFLKNLKNIDNLNTKFLYIVTNEVGMSIVPENKLARLFRDIVGKTNQKIAEISKQVYIVISAIAWRLK